MPCSLESGKLFHSIPLDRSLAVVSKQRELFSSPNGQASGWDLNISLGQASSTPWDCDQSWQQYIHISQLNGNIPYHLWIPFTACNNDKPPKYCSELCKFYKRDAVSERASEWLRSPTNRAVRTYSMVRRQAFD